MLDKLRKSSGGGDHTVWKVLLSNAQTVIFGFSKMAANSFASFKTAFQSAAPQRESDAFAFAYYLGTPEPRAVWPSVYSAEEEFRRIGWGVSFRLSLANQNFGICDSYPSRFVVPASVSDDDLKESASFRGHSRVIACVWLDPVSRAPLARCSQPAVGMSNNRSVSDERIINALLESAGTGDAHEMHLFDARPKKNAIANKAAKGAGYENLQHLKYCTLTFLNIENIHVVRQCWLSLLRSCADGSDDSTFYANCASWLGHVRLLLAGGVRISAQLAQGESCLVHCSDGWDRTPQLTSLTMLLGDAHYRTLRGFASLIESQWILFGHQFALRQNWFSMGSSDQMAPIFFMFIDAVYQVLRQDRNAFEFTETFLIDLCDAVDSLQYGTFLAHEKGRHEMDLKNLTFSVWADVFRDIHGTYTNPDYRPRTDRLVPCTTQRAVIFWRGYFLRFSSETE